MQACHTYYPGSYCRSIKRLSELDLHLVGIIKFTLHDNVKKCMLSTLGLMDETEKYFCFMECNLSIALEI